MTKALQDVNVVEFDSHLGAAYAAILLAEQGANAVRIEAPESSRDRAVPHYRVLNRSKRCVIADPGSPADRAATHDLIKCADIVIAGFTPAKLRERGLDYSTLQRINAGIIALYMPPLGGRGPEAELNAADELVAALGGIAGNQWARSGNPVPLTFPAASYSAGVLGATAAALFARNDGAPGQSIEVSLLAGALSLQTGGIMRHQKMTSLFHGPQDPLGPIPCYRLFKAADGRYLFVACGNSTFWNKFALALDRPDLVADQRFENAPWGIPTEHWQELKDILEPILATRPRDEWLALLRAADVPCAPALTRQEFINHPQTRALGMRREIDDPVLGNTIQMGVPVTLNATPGQIRNPAPIPNHGPATVRQFLARNGGSSTHDASGRGSTRAKGPLSGILVLDFCSYIAGSYGPMLLAQMGADVIKIESLEGDSFRHFGFGFLGWNQGKQGLSLDLTTPEGREIIHGLTAHADVLVENLRPGRMERYGFDYDTLAGINPKLVYISVNAFGNHGPDHNQPGFDPLCRRGRA